MHLQRLAPLLCATVLTALSQTPSSAPLPAADPVIRVSVNLVQIDAVVTDSKGRHISGLGPDDFEVFEDGKPQKITHLSYMDATPPTPPVATPAPSPKSKEPAEIIPGPSRKPRRDEIRRAMVFLVDDLHTSAQSLIQLRPVAKKFVGEQIAPGDLVSIAAVRGGMGVYEQFTSDHRILDAALDSLTKRVGGSNEEPDPDEGPAGCLRDLMRFESVIGKLNWAVQSLNQLPGRKAIVLYSDGMAVPRQACPSEALDMDRMMQKLADQSNRADVAIYAIDARGLTTNQYTASDNPTARGVPMTASSLAAGLRARGAYSLALQETSDFLAAETGGLFFRNTNGLSEALGKSIGDMSGYYLIGFQPARTDFELKNGATPYHKVQVKLRSRGLSIRYGRGFLGTPDKSADAPLTREQELANALSSPFDTGGIKVRLTPVYTSTNPVAADQRRLPMLKALLSIDGSTLRLTEGADGKKQIVLDIIAAAYGSDSRPISVNSHEYTVSLPPEEIPKLSKGITYQTVIELPKSGAYQIRAAVRDNATGSIGSANSLVVVPDFNRPRLSLSSLILSNVAGGDILSQAAAREFVPGTGVGYVCEVYGAKGPINVEIRLFHDGIRVFASDPMPISPIAGVKEIPVTGKLNLPASLAEGDYEIELIARDPQAPAKQQMASQWTDLALLKP